MTKRFYHSKENGCSTLQFMLYYDDSIYEGTIYIPVRTNAFTGMIGGGNYPDTQTAAEVEALVQQKENSLNYRNIGLGLMGVGTALFKLGVKYGSQESKELINNIFSFVFKRAVAASNNLAKKKGHFPKYKQCVLESNIIKNHFSSLEI